MSHSHSDNDIKPRRSAFPGEALRSTAPLRSEPLTAARLTTPRTTTNNDLGRVFDQEAYLHSFSQPRPPRHTSTSPSPPASPSPLTPLDTNNISTLSVSNHNVAACSDVIVEAHESASLSVYNHAASSSTDSLSFGSLDLTAEEFDELDKAFAEMEVGRRSPSTTADVVATVQSPRPSTTEASLSEPVIGQSPRVGTVASTLARPPPPNASRMYIPRRRPLQTSTSASETRDLPLMETHTALYPSTTTPAPISENPVTSAPATSTAAEEDGLEGLADALASVSIRAQYKGLSTATPLSSVPTPLSPVDAQPHVIPRRSRSIDTEPVVFRASPTTAHQTQAIAQQLQEAKKSDQRSTAFKFSPSELAHYTNTSCEKMLYLSGMEAWASAQNPKPARETTPVATRPLTIGDAHKKRGLAFEDGIIKNIPTRIECDKEKDRDSYFRLATAPIGTTLCQPIFSLDDSFYTTRMKQAGIVFGRFIPDFIRILPGLHTPDGRQRRRLFIIDAKSSKHVKMSHQFQVTLYAIFLEHLFKVHQQEDLLEIDPHGGVWIPAYKEPRRFSLAFVRPAASDFLYEELPSILLKPLDKTVWHLCASCNQCNYLELCKEDAQRYKSLSLIPKLSKSQAIWIRSLFRHPSSSEIDDIEDLISHRHELQADDRETLEKCLAIDDRGESALLKVYHTKTVKARAKLTLSLPYSHDKRLLINILMDPLNQLPYAYSLGHYREQLLDPSKSDVGALDIAAGQNFPQRSEFVRLTEELIETLSEWLVQFSNANIVLVVFFATQEMSDEFLSLLIRIVSRDESASLTSSTTTRLNDDDWKPVTVKRAMDLLCNLFEDASLVTLPETARYPVQLPDFLLQTQGYQNKNPSFCRRTFVLDKAVRELTILPVLQTASFAETATHLHYHGNPKSRSDLGLPSSTADLYQQWCNHGSAVKTCKSLRAWMDEQNLIIFDLYSLLRKEGLDLRNILIAPQETFKMRKHLKIKSPILAQFAFFLTWETITSVEKRRDRKLAALNYGDPFLQQQAFQLQFLGRHLGNIPKENEISDPTSPREIAANNASTVTKEPSNKPYSKFIGKFKVLSLCQDGAFDGGSICKWVISPETENGKIHRVRYDNMRTVLRSYGSDLPAIASVVGFNPVNKIVYIEGKYDNMTKDVELKEGSTYILEPREFSPTLTLSLDRYSTIQANDSVFLDILHDPNGWGLVAPEDARRLKDATTKSPVRRYDMTASQDDAFIGVMMSRLRIIWGPPGSGKTFFLASTILRYVDSLIRMAAEGQEGRKEVTIVLTAFTHSAVDNLVHRIMQLHKDIAPRDGCEHFVQPLNIYRIVDASQVTQYTKIVPSEVKVCDAKKLKSITGNLASNASNMMIRIVAGTVWKVRVASSGKDRAPFMQNVDMLMIDEGSQLLAADAIHAIECLDPMNGRLIVAGDHMQLRPVVVGSYPKARSAIDPMGSIMTNLMRDHNGAPVPDHWMESAASCFPDVGPCTSQLLDNFRMNHQLGEFLQRVYGPSYRVHSVTEKRLPYASTFEWNLPFALQTILDPTKSAVCVELAITGQGRLSNKARSDSNVAAKIEASFVAGIAEAYLQAVGRSTKTSLFIAVPHHVQRLAILSAVSCIPQLSNSNDDIIDTYGSSSLDELFLHGEGYASLQEMYPNALIKIDTIEKMQGQEADCVIACFALFNENALLSQLEFLYNVNRWVVGLSRARCKTILMVSPEIKAPKVITGSSSSLVEGDAETGTTFGNIVGDGMPSSRPILNRHSTSQRSVHTSARPLARPAVEADGEVAASISQRPAVRASEMASVDGWGLLRAFESYAACLGAKQTWSLTEEALIQMGLD